MKSYILLALLSLGAGQVHAADSGLVQSEFLHQTEEGTFDFTPGIGGTPEMTLLGGAPGYALSTAKFRQYSGTKANLTALPVDLALEYGFLPELSLGFQLEYLNEKLSISGCPDNKTCTSITVKGLSDPRIYLHGRLGAGPGVFLYGLNVSFSVEKRETKLNGDVNAASGGTTATPFVAYQLPLPVGVLGARVAYDIYQSDRSQTEDTNAGTVSSKDSDGNNFAFAVFYEFPLESVSLGAAFNYSSAGSAKTKQNGETASDNDAEDEYGLKIYAPIHFTGATLVPNLTYVHLRYTSSQSTFTDVDGYALGAALRIAF